MRRLILLLAVVMLFTGCVSGGFGSFLDVKVDHDRVATVNGFADIAITAENAVRFQFTTYSGSGRIIERHDNRAIWQAPGEPGSYIIDALVTTPAQSTLIRMNIKVVKFPVSVVEAELRDDGLGGKSVRLQALNMADQKVTDFRVKLLLVNGSGERVAHGGDYHFTGEVTAAGLVPQAAQWYILPLEGASEAVKVYAWVYEAAFEDGSVLKLNEQ